VPYLISWGILTFSTNVEMLYAGRFFSGIATGSSCVVAPMFISEIAETSLRGALGAFFQLFLTVGILFVYVVGAFTTWVQLSAICAIFPILLIITVFCIPDSPIYLVKKARINYLILFAKSIDMSNNIIITICISVGLATRSWSR
jgi:MFS family permease